MEHAIITIGIIAITVITSLSAFNNNKIYNDFIFFPPAIQHNRQWWRFFSSGLIHADYSHLIFNMITLFLFGAGPAKTPVGTMFLGLEYQFNMLFGAAGRWIYLGMYVLALLVALIPTYAKHKDNNYYYGLGASGAVSAVIFAGIMLNPLSGMGLFIIPIWVAAFIFGAIYLAVSYWLDKRGQDNIGHSAHIFGAIFGAGFIIIAASVLTDYPVFKMFIEQIKNADPSKLIQFGSWQ